MINSIILILFGAPGAGKGTIAQYMKENYEVCHFSTGNVLRIEVKSKSSIGLKIERIMGTRGLVGDNIVKIFLALLVHLRLSFWMGIRGPKIRPKCWIVLRMASCVILSVC